MKTANSRALIVLALWLGAAVVCGLAVQPGIAHAQVTVTDDGPPGDFNGDPDMPDTAPPKSSGTYRGVGGGYSAGSLSPMSQTNVLVDATSERLYGRMWLQGVLRVLRLYWGW